MQNATNNESLSERLMRSLNNLADASQRLEELSDALTGSSPKTGENVKVEPPAFVFVARMNTAIEQIDAYVNSIRQQTSRIHAALLN